MLEVSSLIPLASESKGFAFWVELVAPGLPSAGYLSYVLMGFGNRGIVADKWSGRLLWVCAIGSAVGFYMVAVERQTQNRAKMMAEALADAGASIDASIEDDVDIRRLGEVAEEIEAQGRSTNTT
ncbi:hypothetical protein KY290_014871 [Solanum tuberosum]|uniref:Uncharacterized protein n=1 Tax=Solanum tuberosum TaxID=4113 RepID=A0ABQ7VQX8_SOLTU|nr:hypothetical protein KY290_014871 [Solanum tuberosum]